MHSSPRHCDFQYLVIFILALTCFAWSKASMAEHDCGDGFVDDHGRPRVEGVRCRDMGEGFPLSWSGGRSTMYLLAGDGVVDTPAVDSMRDVLHDVTERVGDAMTAMGTVRLPTTAHVILLADRHPDDDGSGTRPIYSETFDLASSGSDCPIVFYDSNHLDVGGARRRLAHELFHCIQRKTWPAQYANSGPWWLEGTATWFEYLAFPSASAPPHLAEVINIFHHRSWSISLVNMSYGASVFFAWLGQEDPTRIPAFVNQLAIGRESQLVGAARALSPTEYQRFAEDYLDNHIHFPGGAWAGEVEYPEDWVTTGDPRHDPDLVARMVPLRLFRKRLHFVPGRYSPTVDFGRETVHFSRDDGPWEELEHRVRVECDHEQVFRLASMTSLAAMTPGDAFPDLTVHPGTEEEVRCANCGVRGAGVRRERCVVGTWRIDPESWTGCAWANDFVSSMSPGHVGGHVECNMRGEVTATFNEDGTFSGRIADFISTVSMEFPIRRGTPIRMSTTSNIAQATTSGDWATLDGNFTLCNTETEGEGLMTVSGSGVRRSSPLPLAGTGTREFNYTCEGDRLRVQVEVPGGSGGYSFEMERVPPW